MTELIYNNKGMSLDKKEGQLVTCGIFYCRDSAEIKGCGSLQTSSWLDSDVLRNRQQKHTAVRYLQGQNETVQTLKIREYEKNSNRFNYVIDYAEWFYTRKPDNFFYNCDI